MKTYKFYQRLISKNKLFFVGEMSIPSNRLEWRIPIKTSIGIRTKEEALGQPKPIETITYYKRGNNESMCVFVADVTQFEISKDSIK